jgi:hypothetical protein
MHTSFEISQFVNTSENIAMLGSQSHGTTARENSQGGRKRKPPVNEGGTWVFVPDRLINVDTSRMSFAKPAVKKVAAFCTVDKNVSLNARCESGSDSD